MVRYLFLQYTYFLIKNSKLSCLNLLKNLILDLVTGNYLQHGSGIETNPSSKIEFILNTTSVSVCNKLKINWTWEMPGGRVKM